MANIAPISSISTPARKFLPGAREKLLAHLSGPADGSTSTASLQQQQWSGVLGVVLESAKAQEDWDLTQALVRAGAAIGALDLHEAIKAGQEDLVVALVQHGATVDAQDEHGRTPLHTATEKGIEKMVQLLLQKGAPTDKQDGDGCTPLFLAAQAGRAVAVRALMAAGADPTRRNHGDWTPLEAAAQNEHGEVLEIMGEFGADVNFLDDAGWAVLHWAKGQAVVDALVEAGANIEIRNLRQLTPLAHAAKACNVETVRALVNHGAKVNTHDADDGDTPLHFAAQWAGREGAAELVDFLLRSGADETLANNNGKRPADVVGQLGFRHFVYLERAHNLLAAAPSDRAWRRRGLLLLCRARHIKGSLLVTADSDEQRTIDTQEPGSSGPAGGGTAQERAAGEWSRALVWVVVLELGKEGIFRAVAGYL